MKKLKLLPSILMLVACVAVLGVGVFAVAPTQNTISGTITIDASANPVSIQVLVDGVPKGDPVDVRSGATFEFEEFIFDSSSLNTIYDMPDHVITFKVQNKSANPLGVYFHKTPDVDKYNQEEDGIGAGYAKIDNILTEDVLVENVLTATLTPYLYCAPNDDDANTYFDVAEMNIRFSMIDFSTTEVSDLAYNYKLNIEPYVPNVTAQEVDASAPVYAADENGYIYPDSIETQATVINKKFIKIPLKKEDGSDYTKLPYDVLKGSTSVVGVVVPSNVSATKKADIYYVEYISQFNDCNSLVWVCWCSDFFALADMGKQSGFGSANKVYLNGTKTFHHGWFNSHDIVEFSSSLSSFTYPNIDGGNNNPFNRCAVDIFKILIIPEMENFMNFEGGGMFNPTTKVLYADNLIIKPKQGLTSGDFTLYLDNEEGALGWTYQGANGAVSETLTHTDKDTEIKYYFVEQ